MNELDKQGRLDFAGACITRGRDILMVQEGHDEAKGLWSLPIGKVEPEESAKSCGRREVEEETGYEIKVVGQPCIIKLKGNELRSLSRFDDKIINLHIFPGETVGGKMSAGDDVLGVQWVSKSEIHDRLSLRGEWVKEITDTMHSTLS
jgi:ADP-ribose pyrophosphatase YjhB (NUDIX family)